MRQAIITRYHGQTNFRGARVSARADAGRMTIPWNHSKDAEGNHAAVAEAFARKLGWFGEWFAGGMPPKSPDDNCYVMREFRSDSERRRFRDAKLVVVRS